MFFTGLILGVPVGMWLALSIYIWSSGMIGEAIARSMARMVMFLVVTAFALGALTVWGVPKLWSFLKPLIHQVTA